MIRTEHEYTNRILIRNFDDMQIPHNTRRGPVRIRINIRISIRSIRISSIVIFTAENIVIGIIIIIQI